MQKPLARALSNGAGVTGQTSAPIMPRPKHCFVVAQRIKRLLFYPYNYIHNYNISGVSNVVNASKSK